jgi:hypothetical protein
LIQSALAYQRNDPAVDGKADWSTPEQVAESFTLSWMECTEEELAAAVSAAQRRLAQ